MSKTGPGRGKEGKGERGREESEERRMRRPLILSFFPVFRYSEGYINFVSDC